MEDDATRRRCLDGGGGGGARVEEEEATEAHGALRRAEEAHRMMQSWDNGYAALPERAHAMDAGGEELRPVESGEKGKSPV